MAAFATAQARRAGIGSGLVIAVLLLMLTSATAFAHGGHRHAVQDAAIAYSINAVDVASVAGAPPAMDLRNTGASERRIAGAGGYGQSLKLAAVVNAAPGSPAVGHCSCASTCGGCCTAAGCCGAADHAAEAGFRPRMAPLHFVRAQSRALTGIVAERLPRPPNTTSLS